MRSFRNFLDLITTAVSLVLVTVLFPRTVDAQVLNMVDGAQWESCTGRFYDSGGSAANYGNNELLTATLCPTGGVGAGPTTRVEFTLWNVAAGDVLTVHDGSTVADPVLVVGSSSNSLLGQVVSASGPSGCLTFVWSSNATGVAAGWEAHVRTGPDAGTDGSTTVCDNAPAFGLFGSLGGDPDAGGAWTLNGDPVSPTYTPGTSEPGNYVYTVNGVPPCGSATAQVVVNEVPAPDAGQGRTITVCSNDAPFSMRSRLLGSPQPGGFWNGGRSDLFDPATEGSNMFTYTVPGTAPCADALSLLTIVVRPAPNAGGPASVTYCSNDGSADLFGLLTGSPGTGGSWSGPGGVHSGQFIPGTDAPGVYTYTVTGQAPCLPATSTVTVSVNPAPNAGTNASVVRCSNAPAFDMRGQLGGTPAAGGSWVGPSGPHGATFDPANDPPGLYTYTVTGLAPCAPATSTLQIGVIQAPNAGTNGTHIVCSTDGVFALFDHLGNGPAAGGTWSGPSVVTGGLFNPATNVSGVYVYTVPGTVPCANATATVTVTVVPASNAGTAGSLTVCSDGAPQSLFTQLGGTPQSGGLWTTPPGGSGFTGTYDPANPGHPAGNYTYTVAGVTPCPAVSAVVQVIEHQAPRAGTDGTITVCSTNGPFSLFTALGGSPHTGGTWRNAANATVPETFVPGTTPPGVYRYVVVGLAPCTADTAQVTVNVNQAPVAGTNGAITVCSDIASFDLYPLLGGAPDAGGTWRDPNNVVIPGGQYDPVIHGTGAYTYTVAGLTPCLNATSLVNVTEHRRPVAGTSALLQVCSTDGPVDLFTVLGGTPDVGGTWSGPVIGVFSGVFVPGTTPPGAYIYTVNGQSPCAPAQATVTVTVNAAPNAGTSGALTICADQPAVDLFGGLGGTPDLTGTWSEAVPTGQLSGSFFDPTGLSAGNYTFQYHVPASGPCAAANSTVVVTIVPILDAGNDRTMTVCSSETAVNLFQALLGTPQPGGQWIDLGSTGYLSGQYFNASGPGAGTYQFRYRITGTLSCSSDSAQVTVTVVQAPNAGGSGTAVFCSNGGQQPLFGYLTGSPSGGGIWRRPAPGNQVFSGNYDPVTMAPGNYTYTVNGTPPCANAVSTVVVTETAAPNAGHMATVNRCDDDAQFNMTDQLGGNPATNGTWTFSGTPGQAHSNLFTPGQDPAGVWHYTVAGTTPCSNAQTSLTINVYPAPFAGNDASITVCSDAPQFLLFGVLGGTPNGGGTWRDPDDMPYPSGMFTPGISQPGIYKYRVTGNPACGHDLATVEVFVTPRAEAGTPGNAVLCSNGGAVQLISYLGGSPAPNGTWTGPAPSTASFTGTFHPGSSVAGLYTYTVPGVPPCAARTSTVNVQVHPSPNAGISSIIAKCSNEAPFQLVTMLGGTPALNGTWTYPPGSTELATGIFTPGTSLPGLYTYSVAGTSPCAVATATVTVNVSPAPRAGVNANAILCSNNDPTALFPYLGPTAQVGGTWSGPGLPTHSGLFQPGSDPPGVYTYLVNGITPCAHAQATVTVSLNQVPNAGNNGFRTICSTDPPFALRDVLVGLPDNGGVWTITGTSTLVSDIYTPANFPAGGVHGYTYTVNGLSPCASASAQVTIIQNVRANAGTDGTITVCTDAGPVDLFGLLGGGPDGGGTWYNGSWSPVGPLFVPGDHAAGDHIYRYLVQGDTPCVNDTAKVTVTLRRRPVAGFSTAPMICADATAFALVGLLGGTPDLNGTWVYQPAVGPPMPHSGFYDPLQNGSGAYVYTVLGESPCANSTATVQLTVVPAPNAGTNGAMSVCVSETSVTLFSGLGGNPQTGGSWTGPVPPAALVNGVFNPSLVGVGEYAFVYTRSGSGPCMPASATVTVTVTGTLDAGQDATTEACSTQNLLDLFPLLGGTPQPGGVWSGTVPPGSLSSGVFSPSVAGNGNYLLRYILPGSPTCPPDTSFVTVNVLNGPRAGDDGPLPLCSSNAPVDLFTALGGTYDLTGTWYAPPPASTLLESSVIDPATAPSGAYRYVVPAIGSCPADDAIVTVNITPAVSAGVGGDMAFCANGNARNLGEALSGSPNAGGSWFFGPPSSNVPHSAVYDPALDNPGSYYYVVEAQAPCATQTAVVVVSEQLPPNAGGDNTHTICSDAGSFSMRSQLTGTPQNTGTWYIGQPPQIHSNTFNPANDEGGVYTYVVTGVAPCVNDTARLTVHVTPAPNAGVGTTLSVCLTEDTVDLFQALGADADSNGVWTDAGTNVVGAIFHPDQAGAGTFAFSYTVIGVAPCASRTSVVTLEVGAGLHAGVGGNDTICSALTTYDLFGSLSGSPDPGGIWSEALQLGTLAGSTFDPSAVGPGADLLFQYTLEDPECGTVVSLVQMHLAEAPDPGTGSAFAVCSTGTPVDLFATLGGTPDTGGQWSGPNGSDGDGIFDPATEPEGTYSYQLPGTTHCPAAVADLLITVNDPPNAGADGAAQSCNTAADLSLQSVVPLAPAGGTWLDPQGTGTLDNGMVSVSALQVGVHPFQYVVEAAGCEADTAVVLLTIVDAVRVEDLVLTCNEQDRTYIVAFTLEGGDQPSWTVEGLVGSIVGDRFTSLPLFTSQSFSAEVGDINQCAPMLVEGRSPCQFQDDVFVPASFTPNGDGINELFVIPGIEGFPANQVAIFNRWGNEVYSAAGYDNRNVVWDGTSTKAVIEGPLPTGTYYYVLELGDGRAPLKGYVYLNR